MKKQLYFIAIIPGDELAQKIRAAQLEIRERFGCKKALKSPVHITLQPPFKRLPGAEKAMKEELELFVAEQQKFKVVLDGFDHFNDRVIYIKVEPSEALQNLRSKLLECLPTRLGFSQNELPQKEFHPHFTVAFRDLKPKFHQVWNEFRNRPFKESFEVNSLALLKHDGKHWQIMQEFTFKQLNND